MGEAVIVAVSGILVAVATGAMGAAFINRRQLAHLTHAQASLTSSQVHGERADAAETLTGAALRFVEQVSLDRDRALAERDQALTARDKAITAWRHLERKFEMALAYIHLLQVSMRADGLHVPPPPPGELTETGGER